MKIAIVEDQKIQSDLLTSLLEQFHDENYSGSAAYEISVYNNGEAFLKAGALTFDMVFMDIEMPGIDGMATAKLLRKQNSQVKLIFVTQMSQYAIEGYQVMAYDYILKPINKTRLFSMLKRCLRTMQEDAAEQTITLKTQFGQSSITIGSIRFVEVLGHRCIVHADQDYEVWLGLNKIAEMLADYTFYRISNCFLVNLKFVKQMKGYEVTVCEDVLNVGRERKKGFQQVLAEYLGR